MVAMVMICVSVYAGARLPTLEFTKADGSDYVCIAQAPSPHMPTLLATNQPTIGSHTNSYAGHEYRIDHAANTLLRDDGVVGELRWYYTPTFYGVVDLPDRYGFAIDGAGRGWLMCRARDGDSNSYLFQVDLADGEASYVDVLPFSAYEVTGLVVHAIEWSGQN